MDLETELSIEALPGMVRIMNYFHLALTDEIKNYQESGDKRKFYAILEGLRQDLQGFEAHFLDWKEEAMTSYQDRDLKEFESHLQNAKDLICLAERYLHPS